MDLFIGAINYLKILMKFLKLLGQLAFETSIYSKMEWDGK